MELKKSENAEKTNEFGGEQAQSQYSNPNDALFGGIDLDTPYQTSYISAAKKNGGSDLTRFLIIGLVVLLLAGAGFGYYRRLNKYNGTYELSSVSSMGMTLTVEDMEALMDKDVYICLVVKGNRCDLTMNYVGITRDGSAEIKFDGNDITLNNGSSTMHGTYDAAEHTISLESDGTILIFKKTN